MTRSNGKRRLRSTVSGGLVLFSLLAVMAETGQAAPFSISVFAQSTGSNTQVDSIAVDGSHVFVGYGDNVSKTGADGNSSTIVEYTLGGAVLNTFSVVGHNDGLRVNPTTGQLWAIQNEDANPLLAVINTNTGTQTQYFFGTTSHGGGYDDIAFANGQAYLSVSSPTLTNGVNTNPAIVSATLNTNINTVSVAPVLMGNAAATDATTGAKIALNLVDPDSMTTDSKGNLVLDDQNGKQLVYVNPSNPQQVTRLALSSIAEDTVFPTTTQGEILVADKGGTNVYAIQGSFQPGGAYTAFTNDGTVVSLDQTSGLATTIAAGLGTPSGMAFISAVPEPSSVVMLSFGLVGLLGYVWVRGAGSRGARSIRVA